MVGQSMTSTIAPGVAAHPGSWTRAALELRAVRLLLVAGAIFAVPYLFFLPSSSPSKVVADAFFTIASGGDGLICLRAWRKLGRDGLPWFYVGLGCFAWFAGQLVWNVYDPLL